MHQDSNSSERRIEDDSVEMRWVDRLTDLLDTKFSIPGTGLRFGLDFLLGLIPGFGDAISLGISGVMIATMAKHGASPRLVVRMFANVLVDALVGTVPILGNLFDLCFKANTRNLDLMRQYYEQDLHRRSVWPLVFAVVFAMILMVGAALAGMVAFLFWIVSG